MMTDTYNCGETEQAAQSFLWCTESTLDCLTNDQLSLSPTSRKLHLIVYNWLVGKHMHIGIEDIIPLFPNNIMCCTTAPVYA